MIKITIANVDRTGLLDETANLTWNLIKGSRGTCTIPLRVTLASSFVPLVGDPIFIYEIVGDDPETAVSTCVWCGTIQTRQLAWLGNQGMMVWTVDGVTFEQLFDSALIPEPGDTFTIQAAGDVFATLFSIAGPLVETYLTLGTVDGGGFVDSLKVTKIGDAFNTLATLSPGFAWYVDPADQKVYFQLANARPAAWIVDGGVLWPPGGESSFTWKQDRGDFRDQQANALTAAASEAQVPALFGFAGDGATTSFALPSVPGSVVGYEVARNTRASATGFFLNNPVDGDTVTIGTGGQQYEFVDALDNAVWGQVLIGATKEDTLQNLVDAINAFPSTAGTAYSFPTWANQFVSATALASPPDSISVAALVFAEAGNGISLTSTSATSPVGFEWDAASTSGGAVADTAGSIGGFTFAWTPTTTTVTATPPVPVGYTFVVSVFWGGANVIFAQSGGVAGIGGAQQYTLSKMQTKAGVLAENLAILAAFDHMPAQVGFETDRPGIAVCRDLTVNVEKPDGIASIVNGHWIVVEVQASMIQGKHKLPEPHGHFRYTISIVSDLDVQNFIQAAEQLTNVGGDSKLTPPAEDPTKSKPGNPVTPSSPPGQLWVQEAPGPYRQWKAKDLVVDGSDDTVVTSASRPFTTDDVDKLVTVTGGTGWTPGVYAILSVAGVSATLDASPAAVGTTRGQWQLSGDDLFALTWIPATSDFTKNQIVILAKNGGELSPFAPSEIGFVEGGGDYRVIERFQLQLKDAATVGDVYVATYFPEGRTKAPDGPVAPDVPEGGFVVVSFESATDEQIEVSPDASDWVAVSSPMDGSGNGSLCVAGDGAGNLVAIALVSGVQVALLSTDEGVTWNSNPVPAHFQYVSVIFAGGQWVAMDFLGHVITSPDGATWSDSATLPSNSGGWTDLSFGAGLYVAVGGNISPGDGPTVSSSPDAIAWTTRTPSAETWANVEFGGGLFVAVGPGQGGAGAFDGPPVIMTSPDGITWTGQTSPGDGTAKWSGIAFGAGTYVAVSSHTEDGVVGAVATSVDGASWSSADVAGTQGCWRCKYLNGKFVSVASGTAGAQSISTSDDGLTWASPTSPLSAVRDVAF